MKTIDRPTHTIVNQGPIIASTEAYMVVKLIEDGGDGFTFRWLKSPFNVWFTSDRRHASRAEVEEAIRAFAAKTQERDPHLHVAIEGPHGEEMELL